MKKLLITLFIGLIIGIVFISGYLKQKPITVPATLPTNESICSNWTLLKEDSFEYEKTFIVPPNWGAPHNTPGSHYEMEWYLEKPEAHAKTSDATAKTGARSVHIWNTLGERSILLAATFKEENILSRRKQAIEIWFYLDEGFTEPYTGIWLDIDQYILDETIAPDFDFGSKTPPDPGLHWKNRIVGIGTDGSIFYGKGYTYEPEDDPALEYFMGDFKLSQKTWYWVLMMIDFDKPDGYIKLRGEDGLEKDFYIPNMDQRIGHKLVDFNFSSYYFGISHLPFTHSKHAYFDDLKCYICLEK